MDGRREGELAGVWQLSRRTTTIDERSCPTRTSHLALRTPDPPIARPRSGDLSLLRECLFGCRALVVVPAARSADPPLASSSLLTRKPSRPHAPASAMASPPLLPVSAPSSRPFSSPSSPGPASNGKGRLATLRSGLADTRSPSPPAQHALGPSPSDGEVSEKSSLWRAYDVDGESDGVAADGSVGRRRRRLMSLPVVVAFFMCVLAPASNPVVPTETDRRPRPFHAQLPRLPLLRARRHRLRRPVLARARPAPAARARVVVVRAVSAPAPAGVRPGDRPQQGPVARGAKEDVGLKGRPLGRPAEDGWGGGGRAQWEDGRQRYILTISFFWTQLLARI